MFRDTHISIEDYHEHQRDFARNGWIVSVDHKLAPENAAPFYRVYAVHAPSEADGRWGMLVSFMIDPNPTRVMMAQQGTTLYLRKAKPALFPGKRLPVTYRCYCLEDSKFRLIDGQITDKTGECILVAFTRYFQRDRGLQNRVRVNHTGTTLEESYQLVAARQQANAILEALKDLTVIKRIDPVEYAEANGIRA